MADRPNRSSPPPLRSEFADDPDMADLVELFVSEMPSRIEALRSAWADGEVVTLTRLAHQLSGAGAGYGYPSVSTAAHDLERRLNSIDEAAAEAQLRDLAAEYQRLIELCSRAAAATWDDDDERR